MSTPIFVIGSSNTDMVIKAEKLPLPGETVLGGTFLMNPGGKGANQAVAAARLGGHVTFVAQVGNDIFGQQALQNFQQENINTTFITVDQHHPSGVALINVDSKGENCISVAPGANGNLDFEKVKLALDAAEINTIVLLQLEIPIDTVERTIDLSHANGLRVILNPAPSQSLNPDILKKIFLITPNESEAEILTGIRVTDLVSAERAAIKLQHMGVPNVIITLGEKGVYLHSKTITRLIPAYKVTAVDTTAAGDCFNGALAVALAENKLLEDAVSFASRAASLSVTRMGAQASLPYRKEIMH